MADWLAPFHAPKFTTDEYSAARAKRVAEHGYTVTLPGLSDILHIGQPAPMTYLEKRWYKEKNWDNFSDRRLDTIRQMKWKKRQRYLQMLESPIPEVVTNAGSILTAVDDAQDAISTLAMVGRIAARFAPRLLGRAFLGPIGWLLVANDILNLITYIGMLGIAPMVGKKTKSFATGSNPFAKKAAVKRMVKLGKWIPTKGDVIQALQTTDQIFGVGVCLGPIVGMALGAATGAVRHLLGQPVKFKWGTPSYKPWEYQAQKTIASAAALHTVEADLDTEWFLESAAGSYLAHQTLEPILQDNNPLDVVEDLTNLQTRCPIPEDPLTLEIMEEEKTPVAEFTGWPHSGQEWAYMDEIAEVASGPAAKNLKSVVDRNQSNWKGFAAGALACEQSTYMLANLEGPDVVKYDYIASSKMAGNMLEKGVIPDPDQDPKFLLKFVDMLDYFEYRKLPTDYKNIRQHMMWNGVTAKSFPF